MTECEIKHEEEIRNDGNCEQCEMESATYVVGVGDVRFLNPVAFYRLCANCKGYALDIYEKEMLNWERNRKFEEADNRYAESKNK